MGNDMKLTAMIQGICVGIGASILIGIIVAGGFTLLDILETHNKK